MKKENTNLGFSVIPKGDSPCIWMDAGLVNFKLCDRGFQCNTCPFNKAMEASYGNDTLKQKKLTPIQQENFDSSVPAELWRFRLDTSLYISSSHTWMKPIGINNIRIGLDDFIIALLGGIDRIVLPPNGKEIKNGEPIAEIFKGKHIFTVISPVKGKITTVNERLIKLPGLMSQEPTTGGYLCEMETTEIDKAISTCKTGKQLLSWYEHEINWAETRMTNVLDINKAALGETAFDGGILAPLSKILPDDIYLNVVSGLLGDTN